jgi:hypothetical protein
MPPPNILAIARTTQHLVVARNDNNNEQEIITKEQIFSIPYCQPIHFNVDNGMMMTNENVENNAIIITTNIIIDRFILPIIGGKLSSLNEYLTIEIISNNGIINDVIFRWNNNQLNNMFNSNEKDNVYVNVMWKTCSFDMDEAFFLQILFAWGVIAATLAFAAAVLSSGKSIRKGD